jgi:hypothetical protein
MTNEPLVLSGVLGSTKRSGAWKVPEQVTLHRRFGSAELDFTSAVFASDHVVLDVDMIGGSIELKVPSDMHVNSEPCHLGIGRSPLTRWWQGQHPSPFGG